jgi:hypothetical protein
MYGFIEVQLPFCCSGPFGIRLGCFLLFRGRHGVRRDVVGLRFTIHPYINRCTLVGYLFVSSFVRIQFSCAALKPSIATKPTPAHSTALSCIFVRCMFPSIRTFLKSLKIPTSFSRRRSCPVQSCDSLSKESQREIGHRGDQSREMRTRAISRNCDTRHVDVCGPMHSALTRNY